MIVRKQDVPQQQLQQQQQQQQQQQRSAHTDNQLAPAQQLDPWRPDQYGHAPTERVFENQEQQHDPDRLVQDNSDALGGGGAQALHESIEAPPPPPPDPGHPPRLADQQQLPTPEQQPLDAEHSEDGAQAVAKWNPPQSERPPPTEEEGELEWQLSSAKDRSTGSSGGGSGCEAAVTKSNNPLPDLRNDLDLLTESPPNADKRK